MQEYIEMDNTPSTSSKAFRPLATSSKQKGVRFPPSESSFVSPSLIQKNPPSNGASRRQFTLRAVSNRSISYAWVFVPVILYFAILVGGIMTTIGVGNAFNAFEYYCIFNANFTLVISSSFGGHTKTMEEFRPSSWGNKNDCLFAEYGSVALALFSGVWIVMVLQCGRGGTSKRGFRLPDAWRIVPPTCVGNAIIFIISCFILNNVSTGWESFCENSLLLIGGKYYSLSKSNLSCTDILSFTYKPKEVKLRTSIEHTDLLKQSRISQIGASIQFIGCLFSFLIVILRCCTGPDFDLYVRNQDEGYLPAPMDDDGEGDRGDGHQGWDTTHIIPEEDDDDEEEEFYDAKAPTTVICHPPPPQQPNGNYESDENSSLKSTTGLIVN